MAPGMILSNEPGFYLPGAYGIRLENLVLVQPADVAGTKPFFSFETLTLAPFDRSLIDASILSTEEVGWLDSYHARVLREIGELVPPDVRGWLGEACLPLGG